MKKILLLTSLIFLISVAQAQKIGEYYRFSIESSNYSSLSGGTQIFGDTDNDDGVIPDIPLSFNFKYGDQTYNSVTIGVNGAVSFTDADISYENNLSTTESNNIIAPLWDDLYVRTSDNGSVSYSTGTTFAGAFFRIEWKNLSWRNSGQTVSFSLFLHEDGRIVLWYGPNNSTSSRSASIGINAEGINNFISVTPGTPATVDTTTPNNTISSTDYPGANIYYLFSYGPENNSCDDAIDLEVLQEDAEPEVATLVGATNTETDGNTIPEVWFTATVPDGGNLNIKASHYDGSDMNSMYMRLYSGTCSSLVPIISNNGTEIDLSLTDRTPGETIYIKIEKAFGSSDPDGKFNILAYTPPPANDACENIEPVNNFPYTVSQDAGGATNNNGFLLYNGVGMNDGVWYGFQGDGAQYTITVTPDGSWNPEISVFTGTCGNLTEVSYADNSVLGSETVNLTSSVSGEIYYINIGQASHIQNFPEGNFELTITRSCSPTTFTVSLPSETEACEGDDVSLEVEAVGTGLTSSSYNWFQESGSLGIHGTTLNINNIQTSESHHYTCKVTNACGETVSSSTNLTVYPPLSYNSQPTSQEICEGSDVTFTVDANNADYYIWYKNNVQVAVGSDPIYTITNSQIEDEASYVVNIGNSHCGQISGTNFYLTVNEQVSITDQPQDIDASLGDNITFEIIAEGSDVTYQWRKDGVDISGETNFDLSISDVSESDAGTYSAVVTGSCGSETSNDAVLTISSSETDQNSANFIQVYPNVVSDHLTVSANETINFIRIINTEGKEVYAEKQNSNKLKIDTSKLSKGLYIIKINTGNQTTEKKIVKQ